MPRLSGDYQYIGPFESDECKILESAEEVTLDQVLKKDYKPSDRVVKFAVSGTSYVIANWRGMNHHSQKAILKNAASTEFNRYPNTSKYLSSMKKKGFIVIHKIKTSCTSISIPCFYILLTKNDTVNCVCKKSKQPCCSFLNKELVDFENLQVNNTNTIIPIAEILANDKSKMLIQKLKNAILQDYTYSKNVVGKILNTPTNIGRLSNNFLHGANNIFRSIGLKRNMVKCARAVMGPTTENFCILPQIMYQQLFYNCEGPNFVYVVRYPIIKYGQVVCLKCKPNADATVTTVQFPTIYLNLMEGDFDGDAILIIAQTSFSVNLISILKSSPWFNLYSSQLNVYPAPSTRMYSCINYKDFIIRQIQTCIISNGDFTKCIDTIFKQIKADNQTCDSNTDFVSLNDISKFTSVIQKISKVSRLDEADIEKYNSRIGNVTGTISGETTCLEDSFRNGIARENIFDAARLYRESIISSKVGIPIEGNIISEALFKTIYIKVDEGFMTTIQKEEKCIVTLTPLPMVSYMVKIIDEDEFFNIIHSLM